ncbi:MAG TPA: RNA polymerase sigma-70 factor [Bacteroidales bacterium]|nr:RNA polymerase sigma-70 factor [Bacteroidales bacterium]
MKLSEKKTIREIQRGNIQTYERVFRDYYEELCYYANRYLKDLDLSEEAVQDVFFRIWKKRHTLHITESLKSYLYTSTRNKCLKMIRSQQMADKYSQYMKNTARQNVSTPIDELNAAELNKLIERTIKELPERTREIFSLNRYQGLKYSEIAEKLSISVKTVEANMGKALKLFRKNLDEYLRVI